MAAIKRAPSHGTNAATKMVVVYDSNGEPRSMTRLNAVDLVRRGEFFWTADDRNHARPEADGPADPKATAFRIYDAEGNSVTAKPANARDMVRSGAYFWNNPTDPEVKAAAAVVEAAEALQKAEADAIPTSEDEYTIVSDPEVVTDVAKEPLYEQAKRVTGSDNLVSYLEGFSLEALKEMASKRYGEKIHHRASKETAIAKIVELEDVRAIGSDQAPA